MQGIVIAGTRSGAGKTTVSTALMAALDRRGLRVQAFKVGPDYIDPGYHACVTGRVSHNLDGWMLSREESRTIFSRYASDADVAVVEGVMGLYDGFDGLSEAGSTAQMAKWLNLPVLLCVDAKAMARSLAAEALGFHRFDPDLTWAGLLANRTGGTRHIDYLRQAMTAVPEVPFRGGLIRTESIGIPERHLGLLTADENPLSGERMSELADWLEAGLDLDSLLNDLPVLQPCPPLPSDSGKAAPSVRIGVARDKAFCFYYQENLRRLEEAGAELVCFSPVLDKHVPPNLDGLYLGGGYPELFAAELEGNRTMLADIRRFGLSGRPIYAECGGFMYLGRKIEDADGRAWQMADLFPVDFRMLKKPHFLGYREITQIQDSPLGPPGMVARGHEFHYSEIARMDETRQIYTGTDRVGQASTAESFLAGNVLGSYVHLHFGSNPDIARWFVATCLTSKEQSS